ncbi:uncharacterized protein LOC116254983 isoform X1 [Nymphaea colorata]|nr:uncharacterized protein LOC116254983 isoform X1 [Nymphaea colorata]
MRQPSPSARSDYLTALTLQIQKKLQRALDSKSQRVNLLQELFADIALEIDPRAQEILLGRDEDEIALADNSGRVLCFYEVLAEHYASNHENGKPVLDLIVLLWSQSFSSHIFALLFHKWLFENPVESYEGVLRYAAALVQGATNVFWIDVQTNARRFLSLFKYLLDEVALATLRLEKIPLQARRDLFLLLSRFLFFYGFVDRLQTFLSHFPVFPNAFLVGGPADLFVIELTDQVRKLKVEPVLLHYLYHMRALQGLELRMTTSTRMKSCLYSFTSPGGPMYPTRAVRHAAWEALDILFPVGRHLRLLISLFFRLLYPCYWPSSIWNFIVSCLEAIICTIQGLVSSTWIKLRKPKGK